ncbi:MAG: hypothetical protein Q7R81_01865 [Candidatus Peregrinibacteria bacterium]|nr:hypothetical protein [Candidatus Peregrinibacteria bacterium]
MGKFTLELRPTPKFETEKIGLHTALELDANTNAWQGYHANLDEEFETMRRAAEKLLRGSTFSVIAASLDECTVTVVGEGTARDLETLDPEHEIVKTVVRQAQVVTWEDIAHLAEGDEVPFGKDPLDVVIPAETLEAWDSHDYEF